VDPSEPVLDEPAAVAVEDAPTPGAAPGRARAVTIAVLLLVVAGAGIALLVLGLQDLEQAEDARASAERVRQHRAALVVRTRAAEDVTDAPISGAERVANSVGSVVEATDGVIVESGAANQLLSEAVRLANSGRREEASDLYEGEAAASVRRLEEALARAQAALTAAQQSSAALDEATR
jgi:hypothetical protein